MYWCLSRIVPTYELKQDEYSAILHNFERLDQQRLEAINRNYSEVGDELYQRLSDSMSRGTDGSQQDHG